MSDNLSDIKSALKEDKLIIGTERVIKGIRNKSVSVVYLSSNVPEDIESDIRHYADINEIKIEKLSIPNEELGPVCKKKYDISVLAIQ